MKAKYKAGTQVYSVYGGIFEYVGPSKNGKHEVKDFLCDDIVELEANEFDKSRAKAWGRSRAI